MSKQLMIPRFNKELFDLLDFLIGKTKGELQNAVGGVKKMALKAKSANIGILVSLWNAYVSNNAEFVDAIEQGDLEMFIHRDFDKELDSAKSVTDRASVKQIIDSIRAPCSALPSEVKTEVAARLARLNRVAQTYGGVPLVRAAPVPVVGSAKSDPDPDASAEPAVTQRKRAYAMVDADTSEPSKTAEKAAEKPARKSARAAHTVENKIIVDVPPAGEDREAEDRPAKLLEASDGKGCD